VRVYLFLFDSIFSKVKGQKPGGESIGVRHGVSKTEDNRRLPTLWARHPRNSCKTISGVARPHSVEGLGMAGPRETLGTPWPPLAIRPCGESRINFSRGKVRNQIIKPRVVVILVTISQKQRSLRFESFHVLTRSGIDIKALWSEKPSFLGKIELLK